MAARLAFKVGFRLTRFPTDETDGVVLSRFFVVILSAIPPRTKTKTL